ncbi:MAG: helix-turn-helix transcriptional regulator [Lachnospiraceae bacterium]|nr:helix-turn-helix transcriptional regulator [Lachnospiraceae bacterium]
MINQEKIGKFIATLRKEKKKMTQEQFAERLGVSNRSVSRWENGNSMPDLSLLPLISKELGVSVSELLNGEQANERADVKESLNMMIELSDWEKRRKAKLVNQCFLSGIISIGFVLLHGQFGILDFAKAPETLVGVLLVLGTLFEAAGFYYNSRERKYTDRELDVLSSSGEFAKMRTAGEMLQFAKKSQKADLKQYEKGFEAIAKKLLPEEAAMFSMVAETFIVNESWSDSWQPWHVTLAVTEKRLLVCGEAIHGRFMIFYDVESFALEDILSVEVVNRKIVIRLLNGELKIEGAKSEEVTGLLKTALKK